MINGDELVESGKEAQKKELRGLKVTVDHGQFELSGGRIAEITVAVENLSDIKEEMQLVLSNTYHMHNKELEWTIKTDGMGVAKKVKNKEYVGEAEINELLSERNNKELKRNFELNGNSKKQFKIYITTPKSADLGDSCYMTITASSLRDPSLYDSASVNINLSSTIVAVKTSMGQEAAIARDLGKKVKMNDIDYIYSILVPSKLKGYVFVETIHPDRMLSFVKSVKGIKGVVKGEMQISEILHYLTPKPATEGLAVGNLVELVEGPFKGEKGKIIEIDIPNNRIVVELIEAIVPIPVTVKADSVKLVEKE